jgi:hypothetical protein
VALLKTEVSEELSASITMVTRVNELGTTLAVTSNRRTLSLLRIIEELIERKSSGGGLEK